MGVHHGAGEQLASADLAFAHAGLPNYSVSTPARIISSTSLFHAANVVLLFALLLRLTGALWPSAFIAALFAWHPLHVESVAWIAERKDVLSTFFALLTLLSLCEICQGQIAQPQFLAGALIFFALGLMSKPMLVTLPFVMLLLDYWPLQRIPDFKFANFKRLEVASRKNAPSSLLTAVSCVVTFLAQRHGEAVVSLEQFPLHLRLENALVSYGRYLSENVWPSDLAVIYPLPNHLPWIHAAAATSTPLCLSFRGSSGTARKHSPYLLVGWLWFLGTLVPVIGLVQVGSAAMADRYTYFPLIGIFIALAFGARDMATQFQISKNHLPRPRPS